MMKSIPIALRVDTTLYTTLKDIADREQIPVSYVIRRAIRKGLGLAPKSAEVKDTTAELNADWE